MHATTDRIPTSHRHGSVIVMVIAVLVLLFIIGIGLLMMTRSERDRAIQYGAVRKMHAVNDAVQQSALEQLREDAVGFDGIPYNAGWGGDRSVIEDYGDFPGIVPPN